MDLDKPNITYCQGGGRAAVAAFGLELAGAKNVRNYYASWAEWGNDPDTPVEETLGVLTPEDRRKVTATNCAELYGFAIPA